MDSEGPDQTVHPQSAYISDNATTEIIIVLIFKQPLNITK